MKTITEITVSEPCFFVRAGRLIQAEADDTLALHRTGVFGAVIGPRDIDAETARQMIVAGRAEPSAYADEAMGEGLETAVDSEAVRAVFALEREAYRG